jgi:hypothetical protein
MMVRKNIPFELNVKIAISNGDINCRSLWLGALKEVGAAPANHELPNQACADTNYFI